MKTTAMAPLTAQQEESNDRIQASTRALSSLTPTVELIQKRAEAMQEYIDETLTPECFEDGEVSEHLQKVRELIMELAECPGRDDFQLTIPVKANDEDDADATEPPVTVNKANASAASPATAPDQEKE